MRKSIALFLSLVLSIPAFSQELMPGKVYQFNNVGQKGYAMAASKSMVGVVTETSDPSVLRQQWYFEANDDNTGFYLRNVASGAFLTSATVTSGQWGLTSTDNPVDDTMLMTVSDFNDSKVIRSYVNRNNSYGFAHSDNSHNVVNWTTNAVATLWTVQEIPYTDEEIAAMFQRFEDNANEIAKAPEYQKYLEALFEDSACTKLKADGDLSGNPNYEALPQTLKTMIDKVKSGDWKEEKGDWDSEHALKYRVQLYEPYSEGAAGATFAGIQAYTNMNNPSGIVGNEGDKIFIMVDEEPKNGATLYVTGVADNNMYNNVTAGTQLHKGLNILLCGADNTHYFIYYTVNTIVNNRGVRKIENFAPIKIHIEGGQVNGFFNYIGDELYTPDTREDFLYTSERATHPMYDLLGKYVILHFFLQDTPNQPGQANQLGVKSSLDPTRNPGQNKEYDPVKIMQAWDEMCFAERILMGIMPEEDIENPFNLGYYSSIFNEQLTTGSYSINLKEPYYTYFNNRLMGITMQGDLYMNATTWRTAYAPGTISAILTQFKGDSLWGPAHEYGHINQTPMKFAGTTEESNNIFSNVANYYLCGTTSRTDYMTKQIGIFNQNKTFLEHGTWGTTRMFWQLWCYYHAAGNNTKFYPRLYELLRKYPLDKTLVSGKLNPKNDMLHFAKMCCIAAQEDLTDFFTAWGFFIPLDNYHIDDYSTYDCVLTQEDIDEVIAEIKSFGFPENRAIILIDDRVNSDMPAGFGYSKSNAGQYGGLINFQNGAYASGDLEFAVRSSSLRISGSGDPGVGFLIYDNSGTLIGFSNTASFSISADTKEILENSDGVVYAIGSDNKTIIVKDPNATGVESIQVDMQKPFDIFNLGGQLVKRNATNGDTSSLVPGVYILRQEGATKRIMIH